MKVIKWSIRILNEVLKSTRFKACNVIFATKRVSGTATTVDHIGFYLVEINKTQTRVSEIELTQTNKEARTKDQNFNAKPQKYNLRMGKVARSTARKGWTLKEYIENYRVN